MASPFTVTAAANSIQLDRERRGEASFTVFNATGRATRARLRVVPERPEAAPWLRLDGEAERTLPIAGADQVTVRVNPPAGATAGSYPFRLDVIGVDNPDTEFTTGPTVTFEVPPPVTPKPRIRWQLPVAALAVIAIGVAAYLLWPRSDLVALPAVRGLPEAEARSLLENACSPAPCFTVDVRTQADAEVAEALAIATEPAGDATRHATVTLVVSSGPERVAVPVVRGDDVVVGVSKINAQGLLVGQSAVLQASRDVAVDRLVGTRPAEGDLVPRGSEVQLVVSTGPPRPRCEPWPFCVVGSLEDRRFVVVDPSVGPVPPVEEFVDVRGNEVVLDLDRLNIPEFNELPSR
jgi:hypothetical protein